MSVLELQSNILHLRALLEKNPLVIDREHHSKRRLMPFPVHSASCSNSGQKELQRIHAMINGMQTFVTRGSGD
jgi:hypothetical protein